MVSFASLLIEDGSPCENRYLLYCIDNHVACNSTIDALDAWLSWSFVELMSGQWFRHDPWSRELPNRSEMEGHEIANGYRGIIVAHRGDEKYLQKAFHTAVAWNSEQVCWRCCASRLRNSKYLYTHFGPGAPHRETMIDLHTFITRTSRTNAWIQVPGFHPSMVLFDFLHVFDLTLVPDAAASVTWL